MSSVNSASEGGMKLGEGEELVLVGCYTEAVGHAPYAAGPGILTVAVTRSSVREVGRSGVSVSGANPSYLAVRRDKEGVVVYAVNELEEGWVTRMRLQKDGRLKRTGRVRVGKWPAHVATVGETGVVVGCFGDGSVWSLEDSDAAELRVVDSVRIGDAHGGRSGVHQVLVVSEERAGGRAGERRVLAVEPLAARVTAVDRSAAGAVRVGAAVQFEAGSYPRHAAEDARGVVHVALAKRRAVARVEVARMREVGRDAVARGAGVLGAVRCVDGAGVLVSDRGGARDGIWRVGSGWTGGGGSVPRDFAVGQAVVVVVNQADGRVCVGGRECVDLQTPSAAATGGRHDDIRGPALAGDRGAPACVVFVPHLEQGNQCANL